jgi:tetratricopeptide (TPR) repeat protein
MPACGQGGGRGAVERARAFETAREYENAIKAYEEALDNAQAGEDTIEIEFRLAELYFNLGRDTPDFPKALELFNGIIGKYEKTRLKVIMSHVKLGELYYWKAKVEGRQGDLEMSRNHFKKVIDLDASVTSFLPSELAKIQHAIRYARRRAVDFEELGEIEEQIREKRIPDLATIPKALDAVPSLSGASGDRDRRRRPFRGGASAEAVPEGGGPPVQVAAEELRDANRKTIWSVAAIVGGVGLIAVGAAVYGREGRQAQRTDRS